MAIGNWPPHFFSVLVYVSISERVAIDHLGDDLDLILTKESHRQPVNVQPAQFTCAIPSKPAHY